MNSESSITVIVICIINQLLDEHSLIVSSNGVAGQQYLPFIAHDSSWNQYTNVDDGYRYVELPFNVSFGTSRQSGVYIGSNGYITFKTGYSGYSSEQFPISRMMVSPYWTDIDLESPNGIVFYKIFDESQANDVMNDIGNFLNSHDTKGTRPVSTATAALIVKWVNVCPFDGNIHCSLGNTFQLVLTSDSSGEESYAIFTYKCGDLNWLELPTTIGYSADIHFYHNHYLSRQSNVNSIACVNLPQSNWSNVVFKLSINTLSFMDLPASADSLQNTDNGAVHIPLETNDGQVFFGNYSFTSLYASSNGLVSFVTPYTSTHSSDPFPIPQKVIAPYWDDIELLFDGSMQYYVVNDGSEIKDEVENYLEANLSINFDASTVVVVKWLNVCHFLNHCAQRNSFQLVLATDDSNRITYSIFTYKCGLLNWVNHKATIGFSASNDFYANHRLSQNESVNDIACLNYPASSWSNVVYQVDKKAEDSTTLLATGIIATASTISVCIMLVTVITAVCIIQRIKKNKRRSLTEHTEDDTHSSSVHINSDEDIPTVSNTVYNMGQLTGYPMATKHTEHTSNSTIELTDDSIPIVKNTVYNMVVQAVVSASPSKLPLSMKSDEEELKNNSSTYEEVNSHSVGYANINDNGNHYECVSPVQDVPIQQKDEKEESKPVYSCIQFLTQPTEKLPQCIYEDIKF